MIFCNSLFMLYIENAFNPIVYSTSLALEAVCQETLEERLLTYRRLADRANERLRRRYYHMVLGNNKKANVAKVAIARELACFIWGMMTGKMA